MQPNEAIVAGSLLYITGAFLLYASAWLHVHLPGDRLRTWLGVIMYSSGGMLHVGGAMLGISSVFLAAATRNELGKTDLLIHLIAYLLAAAFAVSSGRYVIGLLHRWIAKRSQGAEETWGRRYLDLIISRVKNV